MTDVRPDLRGFLREHARCGLEAHPFAEWRRRVFADGGTHVEFYCPTCERPVTRERYRTPGAWVTREWFNEHVGKLLKITADQLELSTESTRFHLCYLCDVTARCQFHHVAPQAIYGADAEKYPVVPLCKSCHDTTTKDFTDRLERYVQERIRRYLRRQGAGGEAAD